MSHPSLLGKLLIRGDSCGQTDAADAYCGNVYDGLRPFRQKRGRWHTGTGDPVEIARRYDEEKADEIVFLDIRASTDNRDTMVDVVRRTAEQVFMPLCVGGGIRTMDDIRRMLNAGADKVSVNTPAIENPDFINASSARFGAQCIVVAIDAMKYQPGEGEGYYVKSHGGRDGGRATRLEPVAWAK